MDFDKLSSQASRVFFTAAFTLFTVAVIQWFLSWFHLSLFGRTYTPGRLLEFAVISLIFVIALLLRQIREELRKPKP
ncbi:MAG: hypothetical protein HYR48_03985 [Gemmatimonadetes bacterium]|nr:hypothetical protein [Gemmatimonadota bacterium]